MNRMLGNVEQQTATIHQVFVRLGLSDIAAAEFTDNGIINMNCLRTLTEEALNQLIKQVQSDRNGGAGLVVPFVSQQYVHVICFWANRMYIIGAPYDAALVTQPLAETWNEIRKAEAEATEAPDDLVKKPEVYKKRYQVVPLEREHDHILTL
jgi:hypothetical protein